MRQKTSVSTLKHSWGLIVAKNSRFPTEIVNLSFGKKEDPSLLPDGHDEVSMIGR